MGGLFSIDKVKTNLSTDILFGCVSGFILITFFFAFIISGVYRHASPDRAFMWIKAIGAGTFFGYSQICLQIHGAHLYEKEYFGVQGLFVWIQPIIFALLVMFESNYFCLFHVTRSAGGLNNRDTIRYAPIGGAGGDGEGALAGFDDMDSSGRAEDKNREGDVEMASTRNVLGPNKGQGPRLVTLPGAYDDEEEAESQAQGEGNRSNMQYQDGFSNNSAHSINSNHSDDHSTNSEGSRLFADETRLLQDMRSRLAEEGGFPLLPTLCIALLEGFAVGFQMGDVDRGKPQFAWAYFHLVFNKAMLAIGWGALLQSRLGVQKEYMTLISMLILGASTPIGILFGQLYHKIDSNLLRQPLLLDLIYCAASGMYMYIACFPLGEDWKQRKLTGVIAAIAVGVLSNVYVDRLD